MNVMLRFQLATPLPVWNISCFNPKAMLDVGVDDTPLVISLKISQTVILLVLCLAIIFSNAIFVLVLQNFRYSHFIHFQPRYYLVALGYNSILTCGNIVIFALYPMLNNCWPFGEIICQVQASFQGSFQHHYCFLIMAMTFDRFWSINNQTQYNKWSSKKVISVAIIFTWFCSFTWYTVLVFLYRRFHINMDSGLMICEPFYGSDMVNVFASCLHYFMPTLVLMYCYGNIFHNRRMGKKKKEKSTQEHDDVLSDGSSCSSIESIVVPVKPESKKKHSEFVTAELLFKNVFAVPQTHLNIVNKEEPHSDVIDPMLMTERRHHYEMSRTMTAIALNFVLTITPITVKDVFVGCFGTQVHIGWDFSITVFSLIYHLLNPILYWFFNQQFRKSASEYIKEEIFCHRPANAPCCDGHKHDHNHTSPFGVGALMGQIRPLALATSGSGPGDQSNRPNSVKIRPYQNGFLPSSPLSVLTASQIKRPCRSSKNNFFLESDSSSIFHPGSKMSTTIPRAISMPRVKCSREDDGEKYWGEILEKSISHMSLHHLPPPGQYYQ